MNRQELIQQSIHIITEYYDNKLDPFFDAIAGDVLWLGPRGGQMLRGRDTIISVWSAARTDLQFSMGNIEIETVSCNANNLEVLLEYFVYTHFSDGHIDQHHQRLHLSWGQEKVDGGKVPKIFMIHISNLAEEETEGVRVYASSSAESRIDARTLPVYSRIHFRTVMGKGKEEVTYFFNSATILWIESTRGSHHSIVHTTEGAMESIEQLRYFDEKFGDELARIHASYLINPLYLRSIKRFCVTLTDGTVLPIPEKKYMAVKKQLLAWGGQQSQ